MTFEFDGWPWKTIGHLFYTMPSFGQNRRCFVPSDLEIWYMTLNTIQHLLHTTSSFVHHFKAIDEFKLEFLSGNAQFGSKSANFCPDIEIWWVFLQKQKGSSSPLLYYIKLCASYRSHQWIQTGVRVQKLSIWVKIGDFLSRVTSKFDGWSWNTIGHLFCATSSVVHYFVAIG